MNIFSFLCAVFLSWSSVVFSFKVDLKGNSTSTNPYYADIYVNEKIQSLVLDTSIESTIAVCDQSTIKGTNYPVYNATKIIKFEDLKCSSLNGKNFNDNCGFIVSSPDQKDISGIYTSETITLSNVTLENGSIGCALAQNNDKIPPGFNGILGLKRGINTIDSQLKEQGIIKKRGFSVCLANEGGHISFGNMEYEQHIEKFVTFLTDSLVIKEVQVADQQPLNYLKRDSLIDVGSTLTYIPESIYLSIITGIKTTCKTPSCGKMVNSNDQICFEFAKEEELNNAIDHLFPTIKINFEKRYNFLWIPRNYIIKEQKEGIFQACLGFVSVKSKNFILGATWMRNFDILMNYEEKLIGIVRANCDTKEGNIWKGYDFIPQIEVDNNDIEEDTEFEVDTDYKITLIFLYGTLIIAITVSVSLLIYRFGRKRTHIPLTERSNETQEDYTKRQDTVEIKLDKDSKESKKMDEDEAPTPKDDVVQSVELSESTNNKN